MNGNEFNLAVAIVLTIAGVLILALLVAEFVTYIIANRYSIFKKHFKLSVKMHLEMLIGTAPVHSLLYIFQAVTSIAD